MPDPLSPDLLQKMRLLARGELSFGRADLSARQSPARIPVQARTYRAASIRPLGHDAGLNFLYVHLNRLIKEKDLNMMYVIGPGHGGPGLVAMTYLEGSYTERYPAIGNGLLRLFRQFSWPYGVPSHVSPETPGAIHEGGELGYSLVHAYGAAFDNPDLIVACTQGRRTRRPVEN
jgi:xylulose-5-phosphate/fructose-6-phosphate phosphoketolase